MKNITIQSRNKSRPNLTKLKTKIHKRIKLHSLVIICSKGIHYNRFLVQEHINIFLSSLLINSPYFTRHYSRKISHNCVSVYGCAIHNFFFFFFVKRSINITPFGVNFPISLTCNFLIWRGNCTDSCGRGPLKVVPSNCVW
jgi:hypothetical protein